MAQWLSGLGQNTTVVKFQFVFNRVCRLSSSGTNQCFKGHSAVF